MSVLAPAFRSVDYIAGLNLNYLKCCWVQYGSEGRESLWHWLSENCKEFREMQTVRYAKYDWPRWTPSSLLGTQKNHPARTENQCVYQEPG